MDAGQLILLPFMIGVVGLSYPGLTATLPICYQLETSSKARTAQFTSRAVLPRGGFTNGILSPHNHTTQALLHRCRFILHLLAHN
jgi:hypothetical protein